MIKINSDVILANVFAFSKKNRCSFKKLDRIKCLIEQEFITYKDSVYVDICRDNVINTVNKSPSMFIWIDSDIFKGIVKTHKRYFGKKYIRMLYSSRIPVEIRKDVIKIIKKNCQK
jgi:hypothetical protein